MDIDLLRPELTGFRDVQQFSLYYIDVFDFAEVYPNVPMGKALFANCPELLKEAIDLLNERLYSLLSKIHYLDFTDFVDKRFKARLLVANGRVSICDSGDYLDIRLKDLGEEKVLKTICTHAFMYDDLIYRVDV